MADATMYDPKNVSGIKTLYVTNDANAPIYKHPYTTGEIAAFDGFTGGSGYSAGAVGTYLNTTSDGSGTGLTLRITSVSTGAITGLEINYSAEDSVAFFQGSGRPAFISLKLQFTETQIWTGEDFMDEPQAGGTSA